MRMTVRASGSAFTCIDCAHEWAERRRGDAIDRQSVPQSEATHSAVKEICAARDLAPLLVATRAWARRLTGADGVTFVLRAGDSCYYVDEEAIAPLWKGRRFPLSSCVSGWVMQHCEAVIIPDIYQDERILQEVYRPTFVKSLAMVPVRKADPIAAIGAYWATPHVPTMAHLQTLELLAEAAAIRLVSEQLWPRVKDAIAAR